MAKKILFMIRTVLFICFFICPIYAQTDTSSVIWYIDRTDSIGGYSATPLTELPSIVETSYGSSALFDGVNDALLVNCNPLNSDTNFTVEVFFRPDSNAANNEQRFVHIRGVANDNRRVLLETRLLVNQRWILDTFIKSEVSNLTLVDSTKTHTSGEWHHVALTYANGIMRQYVDTIELMSGPVTYLPIDINGRTSIGARQDPRSWFKGAIRMVRISKRALSPSEFFIPPIIDDDSLSNALSLGSGWNLVSVPRIQSDWSADVIFPGKNGAMYTYNTSTDGYDSAPTLGNGGGYWANYSGTIMITINGDSPTSPSTSAAKAGWVLVGSRETTINVSSLILSDGAVINSSAYRYNPTTGGYDAATVINPGDGVWINVSKACTISIP